MPDSCTVSVSETEFQSYMAFEDLVEKQDLKVGITCSRANASKRLKLSDDLDYY